ncbi:MAG: CDP-alcohol phosphatidyltransferase family protein [Burkholderiales bacterium]
MDRSLPLPAELIRWSTCHAAGIALAGVTAAMGFPVWILSAAAAVSFGILLYRCRRRWTPDGHFGPANAVTFARIAGILALPGVAPGPLAGALALALFALDGVDGWLARRAGDAGVFGAFADKEGDALLVLMLCVLLYRLPESAGAWILVPGMLRYAFVLFVAVARPPLAQEVRTRKGAWIAGLMSLSLIAAFAAYPSHFQYALLLVAATTLLLCYSFADSTLHVYGKRALEAKL